jgi:hypothetical protein
MSADLPLQLGCKINCRFGWQCGTMVVAEQKECVEAITEAVEDATSLEASPGNTVEVKAGGIRLARVREGNVSEPY